MKNIWTIYFLLVCCTCKAQTFINPSFEFWGQGGICDTNTPPNGWSSYNTYGFDADEANIQICPHTIPGSAADGNIYARCATGTPGGEGIFQIVSGFSVGTSYPISFDYAGSSLYAGSGDIQWHLFIDDVQVDQTPVFNSADSFWTTHTYNFIPTMTSHKIGVRLALVTGISGSGGIDNFRSTSSAIAESYLYDFTGLVFPNPFSNQLIVSHSDNGQATLSLYNFLGQQFLQQALVNSTTINTEQLSNGIYFYELRNNKGVIKTGKVVKQ